MEYLLQIKSVIITVAILLGLVYFVRSGALAEITGSWKRRYEAVAGERDDALRKIEVKDAKIKELDDYIKLLILNEKTRMEIELQKHA